MRSSFASVESAMENETPSWVELMVIYVQWILVAFLRLLIIVYLGCKCLCSYLLKGITPASLLNFLVLGLMLLLHLWGLFYFVRGEKKDKPQPNGRRRVSLSTIDISSTQLGVVGYLKLLLGNDGLFGRHGKYYDVRVFSSGILEILAETFYTFNISRKSISIWVPLMCSSLVTMNCICTALRYRSEANLIRRNLSILFDCIFAVTFVVLIPGYFLLDSITKGFFIHRTLLNDTESRLQYILFSQIMMDDSTLQVLVQIVPFMTLHFLMTDLSHTLREDFSRYRSRKQSLDIREPEAATGHLQKSPTMFIKIESWINKVSVWHLRHMYIDVIVFVLVSGTVWTGTLIPLTRECPAWCEAQSYPMFSFTCSCEYASFTCSNVVDPECYMGALPWDISYVKLENCNSSASTNALLKIQNLLILEADRVEFSTDDNLWAAHNGIVALAIKNANMTSLPKYLLNLPSSVENIEISNSDLSTLPDSIKTGWRKLQALDLRMNLFKEFPTALASLFELRSLDLSKNFITEIDPSFGNLKVLDTASFSFNNLTSYPNVINPALKYLLLEGNPYLTAPESILSAYEMLGLADTGYCNDSTDLPHGVCCIRTCPAECYDPSHPTDQLSDLCSLELCEHHCPH